MLLVASMTEKYYSKYRTFAFIFIIIIIVKNWWLCYNRGEPGRSAEDRHVHAKPTAAAERTSSHAFAAISPDEATREAIGLRDFRSSEVSRHAAAPAVSCSPR